MITQLMTLHHFAQKIVQTWIKSKHTRTRMCTRIRTRTCTCMHKKIDTSLPPFTLSVSHAHAHAHARTHAHAHARLNAHARTNTHTLAQMRTRTSTFTHAHICTHIPTPACNYLCERTSWLFPADIAENSRVKTQTQT